MKSVIRNGQYLFVDTVIEGDVEVSQKPNIYGEWVNGEWIFNKEKWLDIDIRPERDIRLQKTDIYMFLDKWNQLAEAEQTQLLAYRQALRDIPETISYDNPVWPIKPIFIQ
jgi:hypothetical protein